MSLGLTERQFLPLVEECASLGFKAAAESARARDHLWRKPGCHHPGGVDKGVGSPARENAAHRATT